MSTNNGHHPEAENGHSNSESAFYSEEVQEVLARTPTWMERSGNIFLFILVAIGLMVAWFVHYPDSIHAQAEMLPGQPAAIIQSPLALRVEQVLVRDGGPVVFGNPILRARDEKGQEVVLNASEPGNLQYLLQISPGDIVPPETPLFVIASSASPPQVKVYVAEAYQNRIKLGQKVLIQGEFNARASGRPLVGVVVRKSLSSANGAYDVGVRLEEACEPIVNPQPAQATIILEDYRLLQRILHL